MSQFQFLKNAAQMFGHIAPGAVLIEVGEAVEGPGGIWQPAVWARGGQRAQAVVLSVNGGCPVAVDVIWADAKVAADAARMFAAVAAELENMQA